MVILTVARTSEVIKSKFEEFDLEKKIWTLPYYNMKARREHKIPLSNEALSIIRFLRRKHNHEHVFTNLVTDKHISDGAMLYILKSRFRDLRITTHGFRSTFRDWAEETGLYQHNAIEFCLAHELPNKVEKAYLRSDLIEQRKIIMNDWGKYIMSE